MYATNIPYIINVTIIEYTYTLYWFILHIQTNNDIIQNTNHLHTVFRLYYIVSCIICAACSMDWSLSFITCTSQDMSGMSCRFQTWQVCFSEPGTTPSGRMRWDEEVIGRFQVVLHTCHMLRIFYALALPSHTPPSGLAPQPLELQAPNCQHRTIVEHEVPGSVLMFVPGMLPEMRLQSSQLHRNSQGNVLGWSKDFWNSKDVEPVWIAKMEGVLFIFIHKHQVRQNQSPPAKEVLLREAMPQLHAAPRRLPATGPQLSMAKTWQLADGFAPAKVLLPFGACSM